MTAANPYNSNNPTKLTKHRKVRILQMTIHLGTPRLVVSIISPLVILLFAPLQIPTTVIIRGILGILADVTGAIIPFACGSVVL
jgi:hypothetical protein